MRAELATRHIRIFLDLLTGRLGWAEYGDDLAGEVIASGRYEAPESLDALYERALADERLKVDESEWWNGDSIAVTGSPDHPFIAAAR